MSGLRTLPPLHCPECGRYGNTEDLIELGGPCQDEDCNGKIESTRTTIKMAWDQFEVTLPPLTVTRDQAIGLVPLLREIGCDDQADDIEAMWPS